MDEWVNKLPQPINGKKWSAPLYGTSLVFSLSFSYFLFSSRYCFLPLSCRSPYCPLLGYCPRLLNKHDLSPSFSLLHLVRASLLMLDWLCPSTQGSLTCCKIPANTHETATAAGLTFECLLRSTVIFALNKIMPTRRICHWHLPFVKLRWQWGFMSH